MKGLNKNSEFFETIDLVITPIILVSESGLYFNKAFTSQIGYSTEQVPDKNAWFEKAYPNENYRREVMKSWDSCIEAAQNKGDGHLHMVAKICCADGSYKWFDIYERVHGKDKVINFLDVDELQELNHDLTEVLKQKDILLSIIAHDVRSPLSNIKQIVDNYKNWELSKQETEELFFSMGKQVDYVFNIINSLLVRTCDDRGSFIEKREPIYLGAVFSRYSNYYKEKMDKQNVQFVLDLPDDAVINFDPFVWDVICRNLLDNAIRYSPDHGRIYISFKREARGAQLIIRDNATDLSAVQIERLLNNKGSSRFWNQITDSFGSGPVMAKEILEKYDGKLSIQSELGKGTSFIINLF